jgi:hypothetical protein
MMQFMDDLTRVCEAVAFPALKAWKVVFRPFIPSGIVQTLPQRINASRGAATCPGDEDLGKHTYVDDPELSGSVALIQR